MIAERFHQNRHLLASLYFKHIGREEKSPRLYFYLGIIFPPVDFLGFIINTLGRLACRPSRFTAIIEKPANHQNQSDYKRGQYENTLSFHAIIISLLKNTVKTGAIISNCLKYNQTLFSLHRRH